LGGGEERHDANSGESRRKIAGGYDLAVPAEQWHGGNLGRTRNFDSRKRMPGCSSRHWLTPREPDTERWKFSVSPGDKVDTRFKAWFDKLVLRPSRLEAIMQNL
jgi:hypothetical protein